MLYTILSFSLTCIPISAQAHKHSHSCIHTYCLSLDQRVRSLPAHYLSLSALSLTVGPPACFTVSRKRVKPVLSFPALHSKLPGGENRLRCRPCPNLSPRWSGKQTVKLPGGSRGTWEEKWGIVLQSCYISPSSLSPAVLFISHFLHLLPIARQTGQ